MKHIKRIWYWYKNEFFEHMIRTCLLSFLALIIVLIGGSGVVALVEPQPNFNVQNMKKFANDLPQDKWEIYTGKMPKSENGTMVFDKAETSDSLRPTYTIDGGDKDGVIKNNSNGAYCDYSINGDRLTIHNDSQLRNGNNEAVHLDTGDETVKPASSNVLGDIDGFGDKHYKHLESTDVDPTASQLAFKSTSSRNILFLQKDDN